MDFCIASSWLFESPRALAAANSLCRFLNLICPCSRTDALAAISSEVAAVGAFEYWMLAAVLTSGNSEDEAVDTVLKVEESLCEGEAREEWSDLVIADVGVGGGGLEGGGIAGAIIGGGGGTGGRRRGSGGMSYFAGVEVVVAGFCRITSLNGGSCVI